MFLWTSLVRVLDYCILVVTTNSIKSLIPNLSYVSEAAACALDRQLRTYVVPYTDIVELSSKAFHYDYWDRRAYYRRRKPLPRKIGSFQVFLKGYQGSIAQSHS